MKRISKNKMEKKNFFAPWALGLGATRRAAMLLLVMMLTMVQTAWAVTVEETVTWPMSTGCNVSGGTLSNTADNKMVLNNNMIWQQTSDRTGIAGIFVIRTDNGF